MSKGTSTSTDDEFDILDYNDDGDDTNNMIEIKPPTTATTIPTTTTKTPTIATMTAHAIPIMSDLSSPLLLHNDNNNNNKKLPQSSLPSSSSSNDHTTTKKTLAVAEDTPAYRVLQTYGLLNTLYRKDDFDEIFDDEMDLSPNSSHSSNLVKRMRWGVYWTPGCGFIIYNIFNTEITIPPGHICKFVDNDNNYLFAKPGVHNIKDPFLKQVGHPINVVDSMSSSSSSIFGSSSAIEHGNRTIVIVPQGTIGYATDRGNPVLLPPGLHSWKSETLRFERVYDLDDHCITIGPYTIVTVDEGYAAITQDNGRQIILPGGDTHLLTHQKWRFEKFITLKIQTDDLEKIKAASADNVIMSVNSTVVWRIKDVKVAATMAAETMASSSRGEVAADISKLRRDVLKQAIASLAGFIGSVNYSDSFHVAAAAQRRIETAQAVLITDDDNDNQRQQQPHVTNNLPPPPKTENNPMFDPHGMSEAVTHANRITSSFGVEICSINIISANPIDPNLTASLATGAVASAEALQAETQARGLAKAMKIDADAKAVALRVTAESEANAGLITAKAEAEGCVLRAEGEKRAMVLRAEGSQEAARLLERSGVAVKLEMMKVGAGAIGGNDKFFFGQEPGYMANVVMKAPEMVEAVE